MKKGLIVLWTVCGLFAVGVLTVLIGGRGCVKTTEAALKERRHQVEPRLAAAREVATDIKKRPFITQSKLEISGADLSLDFAKHGVSTALIVHEEDLIAIDELGAVYGRIPQSRTLAECAAIVEHGTHPWDPLKPEHWKSSLSGWSADPYLTRCATAEYLIVVRTLELVKPGVIGKECRSTQCKVVPGYVRGEAHVYALSPVAHRGAVLFEAQTSEKVSIELGTEHDLGHEAAKQVAASIASEAPDAKFQTKAMSDE